MRLSQLAPTIDAGVEAVWREGRVVDDMEYLLRWPGPDQCIERRTRCAATQVMLPPASQSAASTTASGADDKRSTGRAWLGSQPLFAVNHKASCHGALCSPKAAITFWSALIGLWSSNWNKGKTARESGVISVSVHIVSAEDPG